LLDTAGHEELSDYIRLSVYGTSDPCSGTSHYHMPHHDEVPQASDTTAGGGTARPRRSGSLAGTPGSTLGSRGSRVGDTGRGGGGRAFGRRARAAGVFMQGDSLGGARSSWGGGAFDDSDPAGIVVPWGLSYTGAVVRSQRTWVQLHIGSSTWEFRHVSAAPRAPAPWVLRLFHHHACCLPPPPPLSVALRFSKLLPPGHLLTKTAQDLKQRHEFEGLLAEAQRHEQQWERENLKGTSGGGGDESSFPTKSGWGAAGSGDGWRQPASRTGSPDGERSAQGAARSPADLGPVCA
jgi:hypothetical protein